MPTSAKTTIENSASGSGAKQVSPCAGNSELIRVARAPSAGEAMATLFASPEFQRR